MRLGLRKRIIYYTQKIENRLGAKAIVLIYHRVTENLTDPQRLAVTPANFAQQMKVLAGTTCPVPLEDLPARLKNRSRRDIPLSAVTFDDGYSDILGKAAPILAKHAVPATVFVVTGAINHPYELWWDALERIFLRPGLPASLELKIGNTLCAWSFHDEPDETDCWDVHQEPRLTSQKAYLEIAEKIRGLPIDQREAVMTQLFDWSGLNPRPRPDYQIMTEEELRCLTASGLITAGAHTVNHPVLSSLAPHDQAFEIQASRDRLEQILKSPVKTFSYPYGRIQDYSRQTVELVRKAGFTCACANFSCGLTNRWTDPLQLPRFGVGNWSGELFEKNMEELIRTYS